MGCGIELRRALSAFVVLAVALADTDPRDVGVLEDIRSSLDNPELLKWPPPAAGADPCGARWNGVYCDADGRVSQLQFHGAGLAGPLPATFPRLSALSNLGLQNNRLRGALPSFAGLRSLQYAFLNGNAFDSIPADFFDGLDSLQVLALDGNPLNESSGGWTLPPAMGKSAQLVNVSLTRCGLAGAIPPFLGSLGNLQTLQLSYNNLSGPIPATFSGSPVQTLWLNNQGGAMLSGGLAVVGEMTALQDLWIHGNRFSGVIPDSIGNCRGLRRFWANDNRLVGVIPANLTSLPAMRSLQLDGNLLMGPIPKLDYNFSYSSNPFCSPTPGAACAPAVTALLGFLAGVNYPDGLARSWAGNDPCGSGWLGVSCAAGKVTVLNLPERELNGTISPALGDLAGLTEIKLAGNHLTGRIPESLAALPGLKLLDLSSNDLSPPLPRFGSSVTVLLNGNSLFSGGAPAALPPATAGPPSSSPTPASSSSAIPGAKPGDHSSSLPGGSSDKKSNGNVPAVAVAFAIAVPIAVLLASLAAAFFAWRMWKGKPKLPASSVVVYPRNSSDPDTPIKVVVAGNTEQDSNAVSEGSNGQDVHIISSGELLIQVQVLRKATGNFALENILGRGGFGVVYKGQMDDGTIVAVKRMEAAVVSSKALNEFKAEIAVLSKVRHRNLVSILGYSVEGCERLLVYEYMPHGALSRHLFHWRQLGMPPLEWRMRLSIALDVARGMEYLHTLAQSCFIHRDLKSANILLADDFRAKVSDFGLAKLAPDGGEYPVTTRLAGTFGYLAPEYAVTGRVTTKADVFSFGVVLMELVTGLTALDESRPEETQYLASWFSIVQHDKDKLRAAVDPAVSLDAETFESICVISELAGHCTVREPYKRPDMGHAVSVLSSLVGTWRPESDEQREELLPVGSDRDQAPEIGIDVGQPLLQMVKEWQAAELFAADGSTGRASSINDSKGSIPARPTGFAESFTSADGR